MLREVALVIAWSLVGFGANQTNRCLEKQQWNGWTCETFDPVCDLPLPGGETIPTVDVARALSAYNLEHTAPANTSDCTINYHARRQNVEGNLVGTVRHLNAWFLS